jgi:hypothetical protein
MEDIIQDFENETYKGAGGMSDEATERLQAKLSYYNASWYDLERVSYRNTKVGRLRFVRDLEKMVDTPSLEYYRMTVS